MTIPRPFYGPVRVDPRAPRLLLLSYHFPPGTAAGALRWQKLARFAAERGWQLDVVTAAPEALKERDDRRLGDLPEGIRVFGVERPRTLADRADAWLSAVRRRPRAAAAPAAPAPVRPAARGLTRDDMRWTPWGRPLHRTYTAWLEWSRDAAWARHVAPLARALGADGGAAAVISCGPPHMVHEAAWRAARALGRPAVMDLRDPWSLPRRVPEPLASPLWFALAARHEARAVRHSRLVVANTDALAAAMRARYPGANVMTVMNGFDDDAVPAVERPARFTIRYAGAVYIDRDPRPLFDGVAEAVRRLGLTPDEIGVEMIGAGAAYEGVSLPAIAAAAGIGDFFRAGARVPRAEALAFLAGASMLVSLPQDSRYAIPSKVFEYMQFDAWLLALAEPGTPTFALLDGTPATVVAPDDVAGIAEAVAQRYRAFRGGERPVRLSQMLPHLSRQAQAATLFDALDRIVSLRPA
jgi:glycosyltransferase involved in cell wall biosynthesis